MTYIEHRQCESTTWEIRAVTALLGEWTNCFYAPTDPDPWWFTPCPAILLIERIKVTHNAELIAAGYPKYEIPDHTETEARYATVNEYGSLEPVPESGHLGYLATIPGAEPDGSARQKLLDHAIELGVIKAKP